MSDPENKYEYQSYTIEEISSVENLMSMKKPLSFF